MRKNTRIRLILVGLGMILMTGLASGFWGGYRGYEFLAHGGLFPFEANIVPNAMNMWICIFPVITMCWNIYAIRAMRPTTLSADPAAVTIATSIRRASKARKLTVNSNTAITALCGSRHRPTNRRAIFRCRCIACVSIFQRETIG